MPKLITAVPKYRKHKASGQAIVTINGRDHYLGPHGTKTSHTLYDQLVSQWTASGRSSLFGIEEEQKTSQITISDLMVEYRKWCLKHYRHPDGSPTGTTENIAPLMRRLRLWYGDSLIPTFTPLAFKDVIRRLIDEGLSITTVNDYIARIKHLFRWGVTEEIVEESVSRRLDTISSEHKGRSDAKPRKIVEAVSDDVVTATLPRMPLVIQAMVRLQQATGMRPSEVCMIRAKDIEQRDDVWIYRPPRHKTSHHGNSRDVVLNATAREALKPFMDESEYCFSPWKSHATQLANRTAKRVTPLSCGNRPKRTRKLSGGQHYTADSYRRAIHRACELVYGKDGLKWAPNQLRHAMGEKVQARVGIEGVAAVLGHTNVSTSKLYAKRNLDLAIKTMQELE